MVKVNTDTTASKRRVEFSLHGESGKKIFIAGSFNDWDPDKSFMPYDPVEKCYRFCLELAPGYYEYKFVVDGLWMLDESNHNFASNDFGTLNSVVNVE